MKQLLVAFLALSTALSTSGSVLHGVASGPAYPQLIPYELTYTNVNSPVVLSHLHGLKIDEALAAAGHRQAQAHASAPIVEVSAEEIGNSNLITGQLYEQILRSQSGSETSNAIEEGAPSPGQTENPTPAVGDYQAPQVDSEASIIPVSSDPVPISIPEVLPKKSGGDIIINAEEGKLQMQASFVAGREGVQVTVGDVPQPDADSVSVIIPELPASGTTKDFKSNGGGVANVNVNVNVNVNGDGTGSVINSTSIAEITAPIKTAGHKKCD